MSAYQQATLDHKYFVVKRATLCSAKKSEDAGTIEAMDREWSCTFVRQGMAVHPCATENGCAPLCDREWICTFVYDREWTVY